MQFKALGRHASIIEEVEAADDLLGNANEIRSETVSAAATASRLETCKLLAVVVLRDDIVSSLMMWHVRTECLEKA